MTKKIYISPSDQTENRYAWGNTNEHAQCQRIAEAEAAALRRSGVEVKLAGFSIILLAYSRRVITPTGITRCLLATSLPDTR